MNYKSLNAVEDTVLKTGNNGEYNLQKFAIPVKNEALTLKGFLATPKNRSKYYYAVEHPKKQVVLHFTAGHIRADLGSLTKSDYHVSVAFVIGRNGVIYQLFPSKFWSGHIGKGIGNTNTGNAQDKISIGIEISNYGFLTEKDGNLETYYSRQKDNNGKIGPVDIYCSLTEKEAYNKIASPFRKQSYYATYTDAQYDSLIILLRYLTAQYNIPRQFFAENKRFEPTQDVIGFKGIVSHVNYRPDGKWDIGPSFDWNKIITGVQAASYASPFAEFESASLEDSEGLFDKGFENAGSTIYSEDGLSPFLPEAEDAAHEDEPYEELPKDL